MVLHYLSGRKASNKPEGTKKRSLQQEKEETSGEFVMLSVF